MTKDDWERLETIVDRAATAAAERVWRTKLNISTTPGSPQYLAEAGDVLRHVPGEHGRTRQVTREIKDAIAALDAAGAGGGPSVTAILDGMAERLKAEPRPDRGRQGGRRARRDQRTARADLEGEPRRVPDHPEIRPPGRRGPRRRR